MKHFITILIIFFTGTGLFATGFGNANFRLTEDTVYMPGFSNQTNLTNLNFLTNTSTSSIDVKWELLENTTPSSWDLGFCDKMNCYAFDGTSHTYALPAGDSSRMDLTLNPNNTIGTGVVRIAVYPASGTIADGIIITHIVTITKFNSISNTTTTVNFQIYPNPIKDCLNINFSKKGTQHVEIYNILGNKILVKDVANSDFLRIPFSSYQRGRYIIMYRSENGKVITKSVSKE